jgi:aminoglycoside phosphotransferase (APT) family kinase protein
LSLVGPDAEALRRWIEETAGGRIAHSQRQPTVREAWAIDVAQPDGASDALFLRCDRGPGFGVSAKDALEREARVLGALGKTAVPVPQILGYSRTHKAILMERVPGRSDFDKIADADERERVATHFMECLCELHALEPAALGLDDLRLPATPEEHASLELDATGKLLEAQSVRREPLLTFALGWLRRNLPARVERTSLLQGDTGPGNFLFRKGRVTAVLDWEFAHFGDPLEDLAWICVRDVATPFGDLGARFRQYEARSGVPLDLARVRYYRVAAMARTVAALVLANQSASASADVATLLAWEVLYARMTCASLAEAMGIPLPVADSPALPVETPRSALFALALEQLRDLPLGRADDPYLAHRRNGTLALFDHLQLAERLGPVLDAQELDELGALLGRRPATLADGLASLDALVRSSAASREEELLAYFARRADRAQTLFAPAMGELAGGRISPIDGTARSE